MATTIKTWVTQVKEVDEETGNVIKVLSETTHTIKKVNATCVYESEENNFVKKQKQKRSKKK